MNPLQVLACIRPISMNGLRVAIRSVGEPDMNYAFPNATEAIVYADGQVVVHAEGGPIAYFPASLSPVVTPLRDSTLL